MGHMIIDGRKVEFTDEKNVLSVIRKAGINIPTLCYHSEVSTFGACRLCTVEDERGKTFASCSEQPRDGMVIYTNSGRVKKYRKLIVELLLAAHCRDCTTCIKSGECVLQELAHRLGVQTIRFKNTREYHELDTSSPSLVRDPNKCILCGDCVRACEELQGIGALGFAFRGTEAMVMPAFNKKIAETECVNCGQCRVYCPTGAIAIKTHMDEAWEALADPNIRVVAQIAPAVRVAVGDHYGLTGGGIWPAIVGTFYLMVGSALFAFPIGVMSGIYMNEYAPKGRLVRFIRVMTNNLSGIPSIVFGLFGMALFVNYMGFGDSILAGSLTLGLLCVPLVIRTTEEALKAIPDSMREGSRALGATKLQTIWHVILPMGMPNIITGLILALGRVSGETAPILFTCAAYFLPQLPTGILDQCMALPYHLYVISTSGTDMEAQLPLAYGTALVLIMIILLVNLLANALRKYFEKRVKTN